MYGVTIGNRKSGKRLIIPHDIVIDELREMAAKQEIEFEDMAIAMAVYIYGFGSFKGF